MDEDLVEKARKAKEQYDLELQKLAKLAIEGVTTVQRWSHKGASHYPANRPNWCRCGQANCAFLPSGNPMWGCEACVARDADRRASTQPHSSLKPQPQRKPSHPINPFMAVDDD